jgi:hypothetical protein
VLVAHLSVAADVPGAVEVRCASAGLSVAADILGGVWVRCGRTRRVVRAACSYGDDVADDLSTHLAGDAVTRRMLEVLNWHGGAYDGWGSSLVEEGPP